MPVPTITPSKENSVVEEIPNKADNTSMMDSYYLVPSPDGSDDVENFQNLINKTESIPITNKQENRYAILTCF